MLKMAASCCKTPHREWICDGNAIGAPSRELMARRNYLCEADARTAARQETAELEVDWLTTVGGAEKVDDWVVLSISCGYSREEGDGVL